MLPANAMWLAPLSTRKLVSDSKLVDNLLLRLYHFLPASLIEARDTKHGVLKSIADSSATVLDKKLLEELSERQSALLESLRGLGYVPVPETRLKLASNLTCGLSTPNLVERGMTLLRPYGVPIVPGSSVKGAIAAHLAEILAGKLLLSDAERNRALREAGLLKLFGEAPEGGERGQSGEAVFFDALPVAATLRVDITTPHHARYYQGKEAAAAGFENPNPLPFLTVAEGAVFRFPIAVKSDAIGTPDSTVRSRLQQFGISRFDKLEEFLSDALASTGQFKGFGAQTNVGYGRFVREKL